MYVLPGLWDAHVHPGCIIPDHYKVTCFESQAERTLRALTNLQSAIPRGFTGIRATGEASYIDIALKECFLNGQLVGPRMFTCGKFLKSTGGHMSYRGVRTLYCDEQMEVDGPLEFAKAAREQLKMGADQLKICVSGGIAGGHEILSELHMDSQEIRAVVQVAKAKGTLVCAHAGGDLAVQTALKAGVRSIEHGYYITEPTIRLMREQNAFFVPTLPVTQDEDFMQRHRWPEHSIQRALEGARAHLEAFQIALELGVTMVNAADLSPLAETLHLSLRHLVKGGMTPWQAIQAATINAACLCGVGDHLGTVEEGKTADLIAVAGNPLDDISNLENVRLVILNGKVVHDNRQG